MTNVVPTGDGFKVEFAEEVPAFVRQVIVATGVLPYAHIPDELSGLPSDLMTHSAVHDRLDQFRGRRVAVVGAGQSALQTAALLHEAGADVQVIARREQIIWRSRYLRRLASRLHPAAAHEAVRGMGMRLLRLARRIPAAARVLSS